MQSLKQLRDSVKSTGYKILVKTNGDVCNTTNKKLYALYYNGVRLSPAYTVKEWTLFLIDSNINRVKLK